MTVTAYEQGPTGVKVRSSGYMRKLRVRDLRLAIATGNQSAGWGEVEGSFRNSVG